MSVPRIYRLSENAVTVAWDPVIDPGIHACVMALDQLITANPFPGWVENVPAYHTLTVYAEGDPLEEVGLRVRDFLGAGFGVEGWGLGVVGLGSGSLNSQNSPSLIRNSQSPTSNSQPPTLNPEFPNPNPTPPTLHRIPVNYQSSDLKEASRLLGLEVEELISIHSGQRYRVYMIGFMPGFPYMGKLDERLVLPRKSTPALKVPPGAVAIAGWQTGIYPVASPGGWWVLGTTNVPMFSHGKSLLQPGDEVEFYPEES